MAHTPVTRLAAAITAVVVVCAIVAYGALIDVQIAVLALAGVAVTGAVLRLVLPAGRAFTVRRRAIDVTVMLVFAAVLIYLGLTTPLG